MISFLRRNTVAFLALFIALSGTSAYAINTIRSQDIVDGQVKSQDLGSGAVTPAKATTAFRSATYVSSQQTSTCYAGPYLWRDCALVQIALPPGTWIAHVTSIIEADPGNATVTSQFCPATQGPSCVAFPHWATFFARGVTSSTTIATTRISLNTTKTFGFVTAVRFSGPILSDAWTETRVDISSEDMEP